ncbi:MAG: mannose-1-phosphate guanyltransferase [Lentisphaerae bacterium]|nr:mannose-1-phosphate guanyltransferase [Lentisphaerota bacterium]
MGNVYAIVLAGGRGVRFWPLSTRERPKQVLDIFGGTPLIRMAVEYLEGIVTPDRTFVITSEELAGPLRETLPGVPPEQIVGEPVGRDTAAAVAVGMSLVAARDPEGVAVVVTADHIIGDLPVFRTTMRDAASIASGSDVLVVIGMRPSAPSTGYGYIEAADAVEGGGGTGFRKVTRFVEKPDLDTARRYVESGRHFWNSGMFVWSVAAFRSALGRYAPELRELMDLISAAGLAGVGEVMRRAYPGLQRISVDYAIMEKARNIVMAVGEFAWDDAGTWSCVERHFCRDAAGNTALGQAELLDSTGCVVVSGERLTAVIGLEDVVVVQAPGATLVCRKDRVQDVKKLVTRMEENGGYDGLI